MSKSFGPHRVLQGIDIDVFEGEFVTIMGESGCGKSLVLKAMIGLTSIDGGVIRFEGKGYRGGASPVDGRRESIGC
ncbi:MAG: ATP-binding cassette domain-containing protein [Polyangiales bacterium]